MNSPTQPGERRRELAGNTLVLVALAGLGLGLWRLQPAAPEWTSDPHRWWLAAGTVCAYLGGWFASWHTRRRRNRGTATSTLAAGTTSLPIVFASQTGFAEYLARQTSVALLQAGLPNHVLPIARLDAATLRASDRVLFVVSTTGEGDPPDTAAGFVRRILGGDLALPHLRYGLLALGDREYEQYCGFGHRLDAWLRHQGATPLFDLAEVDNGDDGALRHWQHHLGHLSGRTDLPDWQSPQYRPWRLRERRELNPGSLGGAVFHLALEPHDPADLVWRAGDIAEIGPRHATATVDAFLARHALDGSIPCTRDGETDTLARWLARSQLPADATLTGTPAQAIVAALVPLPHREYSIASIPSDRAVHLLVRQLRRPDGTLGLGAAWLTEDAPVGADIAMRLRSNPGFHPPLDARPLILVGNGTGIAGLRALLKARATAGHRRNWLLFGERQRAIDLHYAEDLEHWQRDGTLERLDLVFSRDQTERRYVQQRLHESADVLQAWIAQGASVYVCGSLDGMAGGVDVALRDILGADLLETMVDDGRYRRDVY